MVSIILISLIMVKLIIFCLNLILDETVQNKRLIIFLYFILPLINIMLYVKLGMTNSFVMYSILISFLIVISIVDFYTMYIYDIIVISGIIVQGFIIILTESIFLNHLIGLIYGFIIPYIIFKLIKGIGSGDIGVYALCCFCIGITNCIYLIPISFVIGAIYAIYLLIFKRKSKHSYFPFTPCILLGTLMTIF